MRKKSCIFAAALTSMISLGAFATAELRNSGTMAVGEDRVQAPAYAASDALTVPFSLAPTSDEAALFTIKDGNSDGNTWFFGATTRLSPNVQAFCYQRGDKSGLDYLVLPLINFDAPGQYIFTYDVATGSANERYDLYLSDGSDINDLEGTTLESFDAYNPIRTDRQWETHTIKINITEAGGHYLSFMVNSVGQQSKADHLYLRNFSVTKGASAEPAAPEISAINMDGGNGSIIAKMPATTFVGSELTATLTAHFSIDGGQEQNVQATPGADAVLNVSGLAKGKHTVSVYASYVDGGTQLNSDPVTADFTVTSELSLRYTLPFTLNLGANFDDMTIFDANEDGVTWQADGDAIKYSYSALTAANDWLFTRPVTVTSDNAAYLLRLAIDAKSGLSMDKEAFEVWVGTADNPEAMTKKIISAEGINNTDYKTFAETFSLPAGDYIVGFHVISPSDMGYLYLANLDFSVTSESSGTPGAPTDLYAEADQTGALQATISFTYPTVTASGTPLDDTDDITVTATCGSHSASVTGKPGAKGSVTVDTEEGDNTITLTASSANGNGLYASVNVTCGLDQPSVPRILTTTVSEDNYSLAIRWRAVTTGVNEGIVNPDGMRYHIYQIDPETEEYTLLDDTDKTSYTFTLPETVDKLATYNIGIEAYNGPDSKSASAAIASAVLGRPYTAPMEESFEDGEYHYVPLTEYSSQTPNYAPEWSIMNPAEINPVAACFDGYALVGHTRFSSGDSHIELPKFSTLMESEDDTKKVDGYAVAFDIFLGEYTPSMQFIGLCYDSQNIPIEIATLDTSMGSGWVNVEYELPEALLGKQWISVRDQVDFSRGTSDWALIDSYSVIRKESTVGSVGSVSTNGRRVAATRGAITLYGYEGTTATFATIDGRVIGVRDINSAQWTAVLAPGMYIVSTVDGSFKLLVK